MKPNTIYEAFPLVFIPAFLIIWTLPKHRFLVTRGTVSSSGPILQQGFSWGSLSDIRQTCRSTWAWHCLAGHPRSWGGSRRRRNSQSRWWWPPIRSHRPSYRCNWRQGYYEGQRSGCTSLDRSPGRWSGIQLKGRKNELRVWRYKWLNTRMSAQCAG